MDIDTNIPSEVAEDPWYKVVEFLQTNYAVMLVEEPHVRVVFYDERCRVFDEMVFDSEAPAEKALRRNGFRILSENPGARELVGIPKGKICQSKHPSGRIYSSGRFWRD